MLTSCAVSFSPGETVQIQADFISTGTIQLRMDLEVASKLLQENADDILLEQGTTDAVLLEQV